MQMMGAAWRRWRTEVKATSYDSNTSLEELVAIQPIPHGLTPQTWEVLCNYWKSTEKTSKINRENAKKRKGLMHRDALIFRHWNINFLKRMVENQVVLKYNN
ncbi:uncharacterized protein LOC121968351 [Zingiber officinale]|uniref:uncharacterized protein LOC121968351 n=1 Tax=Zingiber officinale TaxID=94328 RepID=UPI001C4D0EE7|nr:uncharacterized protein LOC121968351 [Zingiber officinale]